MGKLNAIKRGVSDGILYRITLAPYRRAQMQQVINTVYTIFLYPTLFLALYYSFLAVVGLISHRQRYPMSEDTLRFCIFVPCHNEETVIGATIENLGRISYDRRLFEIFFIADNCTDGTADAIRREVAVGGYSNFKLLIRDECDPKKRGKPHAMRWGIARLEESGGFYSGYDMFMVLDADNFVDEDILRHINSQYLAYPNSKKPAMIQTYLDSKNKNNIISRGYFVSYRMTNGFLQLPRHKLGLVPGIGGTGFAASCDFLKSIGGYNCSSLVEDLEFETVATLCGRSIAYNHNARIYDEKPTGLRQSAVQKTRWCQGHWYIFFKYSWRLVLKMLNPREWKFFFKRFDNLVHLSSLIFMLSAMIITVLPPIAYLAGVAVAVPKIIYLTTPLFIFSLLIFPISSLYDGGREERRRIAVDFLPNLMATAVMTLVYFYANIVGLLHCKNQSVWKKTSHRITSMKE